MMNLFFGKERTFALIVVLGLLVGLTQPAAAKAAVTYTESCSYSNPIASGTASYTYTDGKVTFTNSKVENKVLTLKNIAAVNDATEVAQAFDQYGTLWIIYRNGGLYWFNYEILGKMGVLVKWAGMTGSQNIMATTLKSLGENASYATHYANQFGIDMPLPTWKELYRYVNDTDWEDETETPAPATEAPVTTETPAPATETPAPATETPAPATETPATATPAPAATEEPAAVVENGGNANGDNSTANGGNGQQSDISVVGDGNIVNVEQNIVIYNPQVTGDNNDVTMENENNDVNNDTAVKGDNNDVDTKANQENDDHSAETDTHVSGEGNVVDADSKTTDTEIDTEGDGNSIAPVVVNEGNDDTNNKAITTKATTDGALATIAKGDQPVSAGITSNNNAVAGNGTVSNVTNSDTTATAAPTTSSTTKAASKYPKRVKKTANGKTAKFYEAGKSGKNWKAMAKINRKGYLKVNAFILKKGKVEAYTFSKSGKYVVVVLKNGKAYRVPSQAKKAAKVHTIKGKFADILETRWELANQLQKKNGSLVKLNKNGAIKK